MSETTATANAGVHGSTGVEFQKHCALYLLFEKYELIKDRKYFICLEHHDDFLFCYLTEQEIVSSIQAYQAKKSSAQWRMSTDLFALINKITEVGVSLRKDEIAKTTSYDHTLDFITNNSIVLHNGLRKEEMKSITVNESNNKVKFIDLEESIGNKIKAELQKQITSGDIPLQELNNLSLCYIDLPKASIQQKDSIVGQFSRIFGSNVNDHRAAVDTLLLLFRDVENTLNQGNQVKLLDKSKRVPSEEIVVAMNIINTKQKAYDLWRSREESILNKMSISVFDKTAFPLHFDNSFDFFKDLTQVEHQAVINYVRKNAQLWGHHTNEIDCIEDIYVSFRKERTSQLSELELKAAIFAAYIEIRG